MSNQSGRFSHFQHTFCEYFPCHKVTPAQKRKFNCLFCYCPLMPYDDCGGNYKIVGGVKDCSECLVPHLDYDYVVSCLEEKMTKHKEVQYGKEKHEESPDSDYGSDAL